MRIYGVEIGNRVAHPLSERSEEVSIASQLQIKKFKNQADALRKLYGELLVRKIIKETFAIQDQDIHLGKGDYGKPFLENYPDFHYNLSHSGNWILCIIANKPVGIDIEEIKGSNIEIAKRFFHKKEIEYLLEKSRMEQNEAFFDLWTLKESYIKQLGKGLFIDLKDFAITKKEGEWIVTSNRYREDVFFKQYESFEGYKIAACGMTKDFPDEIIYVQHI